MVKPYVRFIDKLNAANGIIPEEPLFQYIAARAAYAAASLLILAVSIFLLIRISGDPAALLAPPSASEAQLQEIRLRLGLDHSLPVQFGSFVAGAVRGDLGVSFYYGVPVFDLYLQRLPASLSLAFAALLLSLVVGVPVGVMAAARPGGLGDTLGKGLALAGMALPQFWIGLVLIMIFAVQLRWLPSSGNETLLHLILPAITLGWYFAAAHMRITRSSMLEVMNSEYIKLARLKGVPEFHVVTNHALRNAMIPLITLAGINVVQMINASVLVETVFAWPGIGRLLYEGVSFRDFPVVQGVVLISGVMIIVVNLAVDILHAMIDPRIRIAR